jgi:predicted MFS family arabinose efflux permease
MLVVVFFLLCVLSVPLAGGSLGELAHLRLRMLWPLALAAALQIALSAFFAQGPSWVHATMHVGSYLLAGVFVLANRRVPGILLVGLGGALNLVAIAANGGVMPVLPSAFSAAGLVSATGAFHNSAVVAAPRLAFLGDIFAVPSPLPFHNVFSAGDICIAIGAAVALHRLCRSRLPSGAGQFVELRHHRDFMRLWRAQAASNFGDWIYSLAVATSLAQRGGGPESFALLLILQVAPSTLVGALGGPLVDRMSRKRLMLGADILRAVAVLTLFVGATPSRLHLYAVAFALGLFGALFQPSFHASLPNLVPSERLVAANALVSMTFHVAVMAGPITGGLIVTHLGIEAAFAINAASFVLSAVLVARARLPHAPRRAQAESPLRALAESIRYIRTTPLVRGIFAALAVIMLASAIKTPLEPLFILRTLGRRPEALGLVGGAWGLGMVLGSLAAPAAARRWARERLFAMSIALVGVAVLIASQQWLLSPVLLLWFLAGVGNGGGSVFYESLLQERVPDAIRGRVLAASEAVLDGAFLVGALLAALIGERLGVRMAFAASGGLFLAAALVTRLTIDRQEPRRNAEPRRMA